VEWVNLRVTGIGPIRRPEIAELPERGDGQLEPAGVRPVWFDEAPVESAIYHRKTLMHGDRIRGPAIVEEYGSTVPVHPGFLCAVDRWGNLLLTQEDTTC
jgi:N-methylhydantoinase A